MKLASPDWLVHLQNDLAFITVQEAQKHWPGPLHQTGPYYNYRLEHVQQVEREALRLLDTIEADREIVLASVWIHDRFQPQYEGDQHAIKGAEWAQGNLTGFGFPPHKLEGVYYAVVHHSDPPQSIPAGQVEARILWDADKLTKIGPVNIISYLCGHPAFPEQRITFSSMALLGLEKLEKSRRLVDQFYYEVSHCLAQERFAQQKAFYEMLARDVEA